MSSPKPGEYSRHCYSCRMTLGIEDFKIKNRAGREYYSDKCSVCVKKFNRMNSKKKRK